MSNKRTILTLVGMLLAVNLVLGTRWYFASHSGKASLACANNLRNIAAGKEKWVQENHKTTNDVPTWEDILPYMTGKPGCPKGGTYTLGRVGEPPTCSIGGEGHTLPPN